MLLDRADSLAVPGQYPVASRAQLESLLVHRGCHLTGLVSEARPSLVLRDNRESDDEYLKARFWTM
jgi:hypothetical protein